jgi:hypothetical protein
VKLTNNGGKKNASLEMFIYNMQGQLLSQSAFIENEVNTINTTSFSPGIYFLNIRDNNTFFFSGKFVKIAE